MIKYENNCVGCTSVGLYCMGTGCPNHETPVYYCDDCGQELDDVYKVNGAHLCEDCLKELFRIEVDE